MPNIDERFKRPSGRSSSSVSCALVSPFKLSLRDLVEMMAGRGIYLALTTIMRGIGRSELGVPGGSTKPTSRLRAGGDRFASYEGAKVNRRFPVSGALRRRTRRDPR
jgi:hypothetical protein